MAKDQDWHRSQMMGAPTPTRGPSATGGWSPPPSRVAPTRNSWPVRPTGLA